MIVNTKTGKLTVTKTEQRQLKTALGLLANLEQHGTGDVSDTASEAATAIQEVFNALAGPPAVVEGAAGKPPY